MISCDPEIMIHWCRLCRRAALRCEELARRSGSQDSRPNLWSRFGSACQLSCFELMFPNLLRKFDAADGDCCSLESFKSEHWSNPLFDAAMILLHHIIQVLAGSYSNALRHRSR